MRTACEPNSDQWNPLFSPFIRLCLILLASAACLAGCTLVGPDYRKPSAGIADQWLENGDPRVKSEPAVTRNWWKVFQDPVLDHLIETAYRQNLTVQAAAVRIFEARAQLGIAVGELYPQVQQASGAFNYNRISQRSATAAQPGDIQDVGIAYSQAQIGLGASWELDFWGKYRRAVESADASLFSSVAAYDNALVSLTGDVAGTYVLIRTLEERLKIARDNVLIQKESLQIARARFQGGATSERDVQQALTQLYSTEATIPQLETQQQQARNALCTFLGMPPADLGDLLSGASGIPLVPVDVAVGMPAELLRRRPDIRSAEYQAAAQCAQIGVAKADLYPAFSLSGNFGFLATNSGDFALGDMTSWRSRTGSIGPSFQWNLFNYGQLTNLVRLQDARFQELIVNYRQTVLQAQQEVENALVGFLKAQERVRALILAVAAAKRTVDLAVIQYREGATDYTTVLTAQQALLSQQDSLADSQGGVPQNLVAIYRSIGGGWEIREGNGFLPAETLEAMQGRTDWGRLLTPPAVEMPSTEKPESLIRSPDW